MYTLLVIGTYASPLLFVIDLQASNMYTEVIHQSYIWRPNGRYSTLRMFFSKRDTIVWFSLWNENKLLKNVENNSNSNTLHISSTAGLTS